MYICVYIYVIYVALGQGVDQVFLRSRRTLPHTYPHTHIRKYYSNAERIRRKTFRKATFTAVMSGPSNSSAIQISKPC